MMNGGKFENTLDIGEEKVDLSAKNTHGRKLKKVAGELSQKSNNGGLLMKKGPNV